MLNRTLTPILATAVLAVASAGIATPLHAQGYGSTPARAEAQDAKSIVEIAAGNENFTTLVSLLKKAELVDALSQPGPFTVFAPTDEAFKKVPEAVLEILANDADALRAVLTYHVASGSVEAASVVELETVRTLQGERIEVKVEGDKVKLNNARVTTADVRATNGVIHIIDSVILPPSVYREVAAHFEQDNSIASIAASNENFTTLVSLLDAAGLVETLKGDGPFTVFAPTDEAFASVPEATLATLQENPDLLRSVLLYHVVSGKAKAADVVELSSVTTVEGSPARVRTYGENVRIEGARVTTTDIEASNGVIHVIDAVILPPAVRAQAAAQPAVPSPRAAY